MKIHYTDIAHIIGGFLVVLISEFNITAAILITIVFLLYQFDEDKWIEDQAWKDIKEFMIGMFIAVGFLVLNWYMLKNI